MRWVDAYFPFTEPSYELEIFFNGGCTLEGMGNNEPALVGRAVPGARRAWRGIMPPAFALAHTHLLAMCPALTALTQSLPRLLRPDHPAAGEWLEVLGCGVMEQAILDKNLGPGQKAWAFG